VFAVLRGSGAAVSERVAATLELESGLNDPLAVILTLALGGAGALGHAAGWVLVGDIALQLVVGFGGGIGFGLVGRWLLGRARPAAAGLLPVFTVALAFAAYGLSLLPTVLVASGSTISVYDDDDGRLDPQHRRVLGAGALLMVVGSGPTLLFVALAARLHGRESVVGAAIAFAIGSLLAPAVTRLLTRAGVAGLDTWPLWCVGMAIGWAAAPWSIAGLWFAQLLSGVCLTGFQGVMDHALAGTANDGRATTSLAQASAARAVGSAVAVRLVPAFAAPVPLAAFAVITANAGFLAAVVLLRIVQTRSDRAIQRWSIRVDALRAD
jgi:hypothetical protein